MVKLIKLITGEEVLAKHEVADDGVYVLENPVRLQLSQKGVAMIPLSPFTKENAKINVAKENILYVVEPDEDVLNAYRSQFGGIVIAPPGLQLG